MSKIWTVEMKQRGKWMPVTIHSSRERARDQRDEYKVVSDFKFRVKKYLQDVNSRA
jgi:hypothetical protein